MKNYTSKLFEIMDNDETLVYSGVKKEIASHFFSEPGEDSYLSVEAIGITFPDSKYRITRDNSDLFVLEYIVSGEGTLKINDRIFNLKAGDSYLIEPHNSQLYYSNPKNPLKKYWINFRSRFLENIIKLMEINQVFVFRNVNISSYFSELFKLENVSYKNQIIKYDAMSIILSIFNIFKKSIETAPKDNIPECILKAKNLIDEDTNYAISIDDICKKAFVSKQFLNKYFKKYFLVTPYQYALKKKIIAACIMLKESNYKIFEISEMLNFSDEYAFSHAFKKAMNISPKDYRKKYKLQFD